MFASCDRWNDARHLVNQGFLEFQGSKVLWGSVENHEPSHLPKCPYTKYF